MLSKSCLDLLPKELKHEFERRKNSLDEMWEGVGSRSDKIYNDWNKEGCEKRMELERGWLHQLENDEAWDTGVKGTESDLWEYFTMIMDPSWVEK